MSVEEMQEDPHAAFRGIVNAMLMILPFWLIAGIICAIVR